MYCSITFGDFKCTTMVSPLYILWLPLLFIYKEGKLKVDLVVGLNSGHEFSAQHSQDFAATCHTSVKSHLACMPTTIIHSHVCVCVIYFMLALVTKAPIFLTYLFTLVKWTILRSNIVHLTRELKHKDNNSSKIPKNRNATHWIMLWYLYIIDDFGYAYLKCIFLVG